MTDARSALIVASAHYNDPELGQLRAPGSDAEALATVLRDPTIGGFDVRTLLDQPAHEIALAVEEFFADRRPDDLLLVHFSCHGVKDEEGELYFATTNTRLRSLGATAVAADFVNRRMNRSRSRRIVLLLDCCYAGAFERGMTPRAGRGIGLDTQFGGRGRAVITASSAMEYAFEDNTLVDSGEPRPSVFTGALVQGLATGDADRDQDGVVDLDELYDYVYDAVRASTPNQTPSKWVFNVQGDLHIARRAHPVSTPTPLPAELSDAVASPFAAVRAAAVEELARLLRGRHAGLALAAHDSLNHLQDDDSRTVAAAAATALASEEQDHSPADVSGETPPSPATTQHATTQPTADVPGHEIGRDTLAAGTTSGSQSGSDTTGAPTAHMTGAPPPLGRPPRPGAGRIEFVVAGGGAVLAALLTVAALFPLYVGEFRLLDQPAYVWSSLIHAAGYLTAGICLLIPHTRTLLGPGLLLGAVATAPTGHMYTLYLLATPNEYGVAGTGLWFDLITATLLVLAAVVTVTGLLGSRKVRLRPADSVSWAIIGCSAVGAVTLFEWPGLDEFNAGSDFAPLILTSVMALAVPAVAAVTIPRPFTYGLLVGWFFSAAAAMTFAQHFGLYGYTVTLLIVLTIIGYTQSRTTRSQRESHP
jgi:hypothetical protein